MAYLRKYGTATTLLVPMIIKDDTDFAGSGDWTPATGDVKVSKDEAAFANVGTLPTAVGTMWKFTLSATEMQCARLVVQVIDSATKAIEDQSFAIDTYGNASANIAFDLDNATPTVDATKIGGQTASASGTVTFPNATLASTTNITAGTIATVTNGVTLANGAITDASLAGNMEIVFETDFATNYNATRNAWATNVQDFVGTSGADPFGGQVVAASVTGTVGSVTGAVGSVAGNVDGNVTGSVGSLVGHTVQTGDTFAQLPTNFSATVISASGAVDSLVQGWLNTLVTETTAGRLAGNFSVFMDNADADTTKTVDDVGGGTGLDAAGVRAAVGLASANLDTQLGDLPTVAEFNARSTSDPATETLLTTVAGYLDTEIAAIKAVTDQFVFTVANQVDSNALTGGGGLDAAGVRTAIGLSAANLDTQLGDIPTVSEFNARTTSDPATATNQSTIITSLGDGTIVLHADYDAAKTAADADTMEGFFQVALRSDSAIASDRSAIISLINANEGSGAGDYANVTDAQEGLAGSLSGISSNTVSISLATVATSDTVVDASPSASGFDTGLTEADNFWDDALLVFRTGSLAGQSKPIASYSQTNGAVTFDEAFTSAPANGDTFIIKVSHVHPLSQIQSGLATATNVTDAQTAIIAEVDANETKIDTLTTTVGAAGAGLTAINLPDQTMNITGNITGNVSGSVGSVTSIPDGAIGAAAVADIFSTNAIAEAYAADGSAGTPAQLLYLIQQSLTEFAITSTTKTIKKLDGTTTAATETLDDETSPTSITRAT